MNSYKIRFTVALMLVASALVPQGRAQVTSSAFNGTFRLAEPVSWQGRMLPAGEYSFCVSSADLPAQLIVRGPKVTVVILASGRSDSFPARGSVLIIESHGNMRYVRELSLNNPRIAFVYWVPSVPKNERTHQVLTTNTEFIAITSQGK
jgi:hypothetical protein